MTDHSCLLTLFGKAINFFDGLSIEPDNNFSGVIKPIIINVNSNSSEKTTFRRISTSDKVTQTKNNWKKSNVKRCAEELRNTPPYYRSNSKFSTKNQKQVVNRTENEKDKTFVNDIQAAYCILEANNKSKKLKPTAGVYIEENEAFKKDSSLQNSPIYLQESLKELESLRCLHSNLLENDHLYSEEQFDDENSLRQFFLNLSLSVVGDLELSTELIEEMELLMQYISEKIAFSAGKLVHSRYTFENRTLSSTEIEMATKRLLSPDLAKGAINYANQKIESLKVDYENF